MTTTRAPSAGWGAAVSAVAAALRLLDDRLEPATPVTVADVLWLATQIRPGRRMPAEEHRPPSEPVLPRIPEGLVGPRPKAHPNIVRVPVIANPGVPSGPPGDLERPPGVELRLDDQLGVLRALRPLRLRRPGPVHAELDEPATAERSAGGRWELVLRPDQTRWPDVAVVVDDSIFAPLWSAVLRELTDVLHRLGAFREVRLWQLREPPVPPAPTDVSEPTVGIREPMVVRWAASTDSVARPARWLADPTGRRLILLVTDGSGASWQAAGTRRDLLARWAAVSPVAVISVVPDRLWSRGGLRTVLAEVQTPAPLRPNRSWSHRTGRFPANQPGGPPAHPLVPVVDCGPQRLSALAAMVAGRQQWAETRLLVPPRIAIGTEAATNATSMMLEFRSAAEPTAMRTLLHLSAVPLLEPLIDRAVHTMVPESSWQDRFEVLHSELVTPVPDGASVVGYRFRDGVRTELRRRINRLLHAAIRGDLLTYATRDLGWDESVVEALLEAPDDPTLLAAAMTSDPGGPEGQSGGAVLEQPARPPGEWPEFEVAAGIVTSPRGGPGDRSASVVELSGRAQGGLLPFALAGRSGLHIELAAGEIARDHRARGFLTTGRVEFTSGPELLARSAGTAGGATRHLVWKARGGLLLVRNPLALTARRSSAVAGDIVAVLVEAMRGPSETTVAFGGRLCQIQLLRRVFPQLAKELPETRIIELPDGDADRPAVGLAFAIFLGYLRIGCDRAAQERAWQELERREQIDSAAFSPEEAGRALCVEVVSRWERRAGPATGIESQDIPPI